MDSPVADGALKIFGSRCNRQFHRNDIRGGNIAALWKASSADLVLSLLRYAQIRLSVQEPYPDIAPTSWIQKFLL